MLTTFSGPRLDPGVSGNGRFSRLNAAMPSAWKVGHQRVFEHSQPNGWSCPGDLSCLMVMKLEAGFQADLKRFILPKNSIIYFDISTLAFLPVIFFLCLE